MVFSLFEYLTQFVSAFNVFQYLSFRAILGVLTALGISLLVGPYLIRRLTHYKIGQHIRQDGPQSHLTKAGTPTMGGTLILVAVSVSVLCWGDLTNRHVWVVLLTTLAFGLVGGIDDYRKLRFGNSSGLSGRVKYLWQSVIAAATAGFLFLSEIGRAHV